MDVYIAERVTRFFHHPLVAAAIAKLHASLAGLSSGQELITHSIPSLKRLKPYSLGLWRQHSGDYRSIVSVVSSPFGDVVIGHLVGPRASVYEQLAGLLPGIRQEVDTFLEATGFGQHALTQLSESRIDDLEIDLEDDEPTSLGFGEFTAEELPLPLRDRYYRIPPYLNSLDQLTQYLNQGSFRYSPLPSTAQRQAILALRSYPPQSALTLIPMQGSAGTGKTTLAFQLALEMAQLGRFYPLIVVPTAALVRFGVKSLQIMDPHLRITDSPRHLADADVGIVTRDALLQALAGDPEPPLSGAAATALMARSKALAPPLRQQPALKGVSLYGLLRGYVSQGCYPSSSKDPLQGRFESAAALLRQYWSGEVEQELFNGRDSWSQAQRAEQRLIESPVAFSAGKPLLLILDEVQDYFWFQLQACLALAQHQQTVFPQDPAPVILLGDENQRVTISGFSWNALSAAVTSLGIQLPTRLTLNQNFRNTAAITAVGRWVMTDLFHYLSVKSHYRQVPDPGDPEQSPEVGVKPRLIEIDDLWELSMAASLQYLRTLRRPSDDICFVFLFAEREQPSPLQEAIAELDPQQETLLTYTIPTIKGQEFEAVILVNPFQATSRLGIDDLYSAYTGITRARRYEVLLVSAEEMAWLKQFPAASTLFNLDPINPAELVQEIAQFGRTPISLEQRQDKLRQDLAQQVIEWFQGGPYPSRVKQLAGCGLTPWGLAESLHPLLLEEDVNPAIVWADQIQLPTLTKAAPAELLVLYWGSLAWLQARGVDLLLWNAQAVPILKEWLQADPARFLAVLSETSDPDFHAWISQLWGSAWDVIRWLEPHLSLDRAQRRAQVAPILSGLERLGLPYESLRIQDWFGFATPPSGIPLPELCSHDRPLVASACAQVISQLQHLLDSVPQ